MASFFFMYDVCGMVSIQVMTDKKKEERTIKNVLDGKRGKLPIGRLDMLFLCTLAKIETLYDSSGLCLMRFD